MRVSERGKTLIKQREGIRLKVYHDVAGIATVGVGHKVVPQDNLHTGDTITQAQSDIFFHADIAEVESVINTLVQARLTQNQFDALASFVFNVGRRNFAQSTLRRKLNLFQMHAAADEFLRWTYAGGHRIPG